MKTNEPCCGNCKWCEPHRYFNRKWTEWECGNPNADAYTCATMNTEHCEDYEPIKENAGEL